LDYSKIFLHLILQINKSWNKMKKVTTVLMGLALVSAVIYAGCKKEGTTTKSNPATADNDASAAQDEANASFMIQDSKNISDGAAKGTATERAFGTCGTITGDSSATTDTIDIHFSGLCVSPDGRIRKGDIIVYWTKGKGYFDSAASVTQTWRNYSVTTLVGGTIYVTGSSNITNTGYDHVGDHSWKYTSNVTLTYSTGGTATWSASRNNVLTQIGGTWYYIVTGGATGTSKSGITYTLTINSPLYWTAYFVNIANSITPCDCIEAGTLEFTRTGKTYPLYLTYTSGVGNCNHTATATINGNNYPITLP
jgi:hypothetical protein